MFRLTMLLAAGALSGCAANATVGGTTQVQTPIGRIEAISAADLATATAVASAGGDANGAVCWTYLAALDTAVQGVNATIGAATAYELARLPSQPAFASKCGPIGISLPAVPAGALPFAASLHP